MGKSLSKIVSGGATASSASCSRSFDNPVSKIYFFSASSIEKSRVARSNVNWFLFVFLPGAGGALVHVLRMVFVWFYAFLFVFERLLLLCLLIQVKKQTHGWLVTMHYTVSLRLIVFPALRKIVITNASLVYDCFWPLLLIVADWECFDFRPDNIYVQ